MEKLKETLTFHLYRAILTLQEAYSAVLPYLLILSILSMMLAFFKFTGFQPALFDIEYLRMILGVLDLFSSAVIVITIAYFFARWLDLSAIIATTLSLATYVTVMVTEESGVSFMFGYTHGFAIQTIFIPIATTLTLARIYPHLNLHIPLTDQNMHIYRVFNYLYAYVVTYFVILLGYEVLDWVLDNTFDMVGEFLDKVTLPTLLEMTLRETGIQLLWSVGVHGDYTIQSLVGKDLFNNEILPNLTTGEFIRIFVSPGGAGAGLGLLIALLLTAQDGMLKTISRISIPLVLFNINTLLIYAIVVFNPYLVGVFILIPLLNILIAYISLSILPITFDPVRDVFEHSPVLINAWIKSDGNFTVLALQLFLLLINVIIYRHALKRYLRSQSHATQVITIQKALNLPHLDQADMRVQSFKAHRRILSSSIQLDRILSEIRDDNMMVYFQPKVSLQSSECNHFEALLRYQYVGGRISFPDFMPLIEDAGLASTIDVWIAQKVNEILIRWDKHRDFRPTVSINLHPGTLVHDSALKTILNTLKGHDITFEILERSFSGETKALKGIRMIHEYGFKIAIDDYGVGYSNLEALAIQPINEIKLDKTILDRVSGYKGKTIYRHIVSMGHDLNLRIVAEGIETHEDALMLARMGVDMAQGFYFSKALPPQKVPDYARSFDLGTYLPERLTVRYAG